MADIVESLNNYGGAIDQSIRKATAIQSLVLGKELTEEEVENIKEYKCIQDFLDAPINSPVETDMKKLFAQAIVVGSEKGVLPFNLPADVTAETIVSVVDEGLTRMKTAYQLGRGLIEDVFEADEILMEHLAVRVTTFSEMAIDHVAEGIHASADLLLDKSDTIITAIEAAYPPIQPVAEFCRLVVNTTKPAIREIVHLGIDKVAQVAKNVVKSAVEKLPGLFQKAKQFLLA